MLRAFLIFSALFLMVVEARAETRVLNGQAVISASPSATAGVATLLRRRPQALPTVLERVFHGSYDSLERRKLSQYAVRVSVERVKSNASVRYRASRNACRQAPLRRLLRSNPSLRCEPNLEVKVDLAPNDTHLSSLYAMGTSSSARIRAREAWDLSTGSAPVVVGVVDTGIEYTHPDLSPNMWSNPGEIPGNGIDDDSNGYIDDRYGIDTYNHDSNPIDDHFHGTHVAGTIGAVGNNGAGVVGVNWSVSLAACKFLGASGSGSIAGAIECLDYFTNLKNNAGIPVVATNNSWGAAASVPTSLEDAARRARDADILLIAAAGNSASNNDTISVIPGNINLSNVVSVAAVDSNGAIASFSNYGAVTVDLGAPGVNILSTTLGSSYGYADGTSMAAPHVTGAVALMKAYSPALSGSSIVSALLGSGETLAGLSGITVTGRTLNVYAAMLASIPTATPTATSTATATASPNPTSSPTATATPTATPTEAPTAPPEATATPTIAPTSSPAPTVEPTPQPTVAPTNTPSLDRSRVRLGISARRAGSKVDLSCRLTVRAEGSSVASALPGYSVRLLDGRGRAKGTKLTNSAGIAPFRLASVGRLEAFRCQATLGGGLAPVRSGLLVVATSVSSR